jgi:hypothetical protein
MNTAFRSLKTPKNVIDSEAENTSKEYTRRLMIPNAPQRFLKIAIQDNFNILK